MAVKTDFVCVCVCVCGGGCTVWPITTIFGRITRGEKCIIGGHRRPYHNGSGLKRPPILEVPFHYTHTLWHRTTKYDVVTPMVRGLVFKSLATPPPQMGGVLALPNFGVHFYLCVHPLSQNYQISRARPNTYGEAAYFYVVSHAPPKGPIAPNFGAFLYLCLYPLTQNDHIRHDNPYGRACYCVARFVSDSWVSCQYLQTNLQNRCFCHVSWHVGHCIPFHMSVCQICFYLRRGDYVFAYVCLHVCLQDDSHTLDKVGWNWSSGMCDYYRLIRFWWWSGLRCWCRNFYHCGTRAIQRTLLIIQEWIFELRDGMSYQQQTVRFLCWSGTLSIFRNFK